LPHPWPLPLWMSLSSTTHHVRWIQHLEWVPHITRRPLQQTGVRMHPESSSAWLCMLDVFQRIVRSPWPDSPRKHKETHCFCVF
jgi:hypothetical protein